MTAFLVKVNAPNKQLFSVGSLTLEIDGPIHKQCKCLLPFHDCIKAYFQLPLNFTLILFPT